MLTVGLHARVRLALATAMSAALLLLHAHAQSAEAAARKAFKSPDEGSRALIDAARLAEVSELAAILGPSYKDWIETGDAVQDKLARERLVAAWEEEQAIETIGAEKAIIVVGNDEFPFPIPLVKSASG